MVTHIHPDHYGLAGRIRETSGAWIALHPADAALIHDRYEEPTDLLERMGGSPPARRAGERDRRAPQRVDAGAAVRRLRQARRDPRRRRPPDIPGWDLTALWTPGHSPGHLCFWEPRNQLMLTGDCVLPRITPNVTSTRRPSATPLATTSAPRPARRTTPTRSSRARVAVRHHSARGSSPEHHEQRFLEVIAAIRDGYDTAWEITPHMDGRVRGTTSTSSRAAPRSAKPGAPARAGSTWRRARSRGRAISLGARRTMSEVAASRVSRLATKRGPSALLRSSESGKA